MQKTNPAKKKPKRNFLLLLSFLLGVGIGLALFFPLFRYLGDTPLLKSPLFAAVLIGFCAAFVFHLVLHEAGHLVFGLLTGYRFRSFRIFSFLWIKENGKLRCKRLRVPGTAGQCLMAPPEPKDGKFPFLLYNLGGCILNLAGGVLFLAGHFLCANAPLPSMIFLVFSLTGFLFAFLNGFPVAMGSVQNDGSNALAARESPEAAEAFWIQLKIADDLCRGIRLKDMPAERFAMPADEAMKNILVAGRGYLACVRRMDEQNFDEADRLMAHLIENAEGLDELRRRILICERIFLEVLGPNRKEVLEELLTKEQAKFMKAMKNFLSLLRTQYAMALICEKNAEKAEKIAARFEKAAKAYPNPQETESERELMKRAAAIAAQDAL